MKNHIAITIIACLVVGAASFFGGMKYAASKSPVGAGRGAFQAGAGARFAGGAGGPGAAGAAGGAGRNAAAGFVGGEVLSKDDKTITLKLRDGGSKVVFYTTSTKVGMMTDGVVSDVSVGKQVTITGDTNSDGSVTAQSIQIRPDMPMGAPMKDAATTTK